MLLYAAACAGLYLAMRQPPELFGRIMAKVPSAAMVILPFRPLWSRARGGSLEIGDMAPDFELPLLDGALVRLSGLYEERPVVLIFGSYT